MRITRIFSQLLIHGGTGQIGYATALKFLDAGWRVTITSSQRVIDPVIVHQNIQYLRLADGKLESTSLPDEVYDMIVSCSAFDAVDAIRLAKLSTRTGYIAVISSASVYCDEKGRTLDEAAFNGFPEFPDNITENQSVVEPGDETYSTRKLAMENALLELAQCPVGVLRPCAVYGPQSKHPREWYFVKRLLDGRENIGLAYNGESRFHTTSTALIADVLFSLWSRGETGRFNVAEATAPSSLEIGRTIAETMNKTVKWYLLDGLVTPALSPWSIPLPMTIASHHDFINQLSLRSRYGQMVVPVVDELKGLPTENWEVRFPQLAAYPQNLFGYKSEDELLGDI